MLRSSWRPRIAPNLEGRAANRLGGGARMHAHARLAASVAADSVAADSAVHLAPLPLPLLRSDKVMSTYMDKEMGAKGCPPHVYAKGEAAYKVLMPSNPLSPPSLCPRTRALLSRPPPSPLSSPLTSLRSAPLSVLSPLSQHVKRQKAHACLVMSGER